MISFIVLYKNDTLLPADAPLAFACQGDDSDHAEEQCLDAYPGCEVVWVGEGDADATYQDYWGNV